MQDYVIVGMGGTGTHLVGPLLTYLHSVHDKDFKLHIIDGDIVEQKNLARQLFDKTTVTINKAEAIAAQYKDDCIKPYSEYLSEQNMSRFINDGDIVFLCVDNFTVRKRVEERAQTLDNIVVINGGNESHDGAVQIWVRQSGEDLTPRLSFLHPEIAVGLVDRAEMSCMQAAALPGGEQTIIANLQSAAWMLTALWRYMNGYLDGDPGNRTWTELQFDAAKGEIHHIDQRIHDFWRTA